MNAALTLNDVCEFIVDSEHKTAPTQEIGYPYIRTPNIGRGRLDLNNVRRVGEEAYKGWTKRAVPTSGDLILAREAPVGNVAIVPEGEKVCLGQRTVLLRPDKEKVYPEYLNYLLIGEEVQAKMHSMSSGATVAHLNMKDIRELILPSLPSLAEQKKLARAIAAYDNLIENNNRRIAILEEMAQSLYREWFVNFRFPGHQNTKFFDSPLGKIPERWEVKQFTEIADVLSGGTPKTSVPEYWNGEIPFFAPKDAPSNFYVLSTEKHITEAGLNKCASKFYPKDTVFITARGTVGKIVMPADGMAMNQSCYALKGHDGVSQYFLFLLLISQVEYLKKNTGGATFDTIVTDTFRRMSVVSPSAEVVSEFTHLITPIFGKVLNLIKAIENLKQQRDLLLPKLISGKINI